MVVKLKPINKIINSPKKQDITKNSVKVPENWEKVYSKIAKMRLSGIASSAAVDIEGCTSCFDKAASARTRRFQILVSLMLSSQTKDNITSEAVRCLKKMDGGLCLESVKRAPVCFIEQCISKVGFYKKVNDLYYYTSVVFVHKLFIYVKII